jgi:hypothetical protein
VALVSTLFSVLGGNVRRCELCDCVGSEQASFGLIVNYTHFLSSSRFEPKEILLKRVSLCAAADGWNVRGFFGLLRKLLRYVV